MIGDFRFTTHRSIAPRDDAWYISWIPPSAETWAAGDREILCTVHQQDENGEPIEVTGSAEGSGE
jgi:hypothetical protein